MQRDEIMILIRGVGKMSLGLGITQDFPAQARLIPDTDTYVLAVTRYQHVACAFMIDVLTSTFVYV